MGYVSIALTHKYISLYIYTEPRPVYLSNHEARCLGVPVCNYHEACCEVKVMETAGYSGADGPAFVNLDGLLPRLSEGH